MGGGLVHLENEVQTTSGTTKLDSRALRVYHVVLEPRIEWGLPKLVCSVNLVAEFS